jgi:hypothetical protein
MSETISFNPRNSLDPTPSAEAGEPPAEVQGDGSSMLDVFLVQEGAPGEMAGASVMAAEDSAPPAAVGATEWPDGVAADPEIIRLDPPESQTKFLLPDFGTGASGEVLYMDPDAFSFHDEPAILALLNGKKIEGLDVEPIQGLELGTWIEAKEYLDGLEALPLGIERVEGRYYLPSFYAKAMGDERQFGVGSLHYSWSEGRASHVPNPCLAFDILFDDALTKEELEIFWNRLSGSVREDMKEMLRWVPRSGAQDLLADQLANDPVWKNRIVREKDLVAPGKSEVYSEGAVAGKVKYFPRGTFDPAEVTPDEIIVLEELPDELPPVRGIVTSVRQGELAHVALLARANGIPNVHVADPNTLEALKASAASGAPVAMVANKEAGKLEWKEITAEQLAEYEGLRKPAKVTPDPIELQPLPGVLPLADARESDTRQITAQYGGKVQGMIELQKAGLKTPLQPAGINVSLYEKHLAPLTKTIEAMLADPRFQADRAIRFVALEGVEGWEETNPGKPLPKSVEDLLAAPAKDALAELVRTGGLKEKIIDQPLDSATREMVAKAAGALPLDPGQGVRFRSSATRGAEDGAFNAAGLYDSYTYLPGDPKKTLDKALKKAWASYWNFRAFEGRAQAGIGHLDAGMGVLMHPNFPDTSERGNSVVLMTVKEELASWVPRPVSYQMTVSSLPGDGSVVRPDGSAALPEVWTVKYDGWNNILTVKKTQTATGGEEVLSQTQIEEMYGKLKPIVAAQRQAANADLPLEHQKLSHTIDLETKELDGGIVYKQMRPLEKAVIAPEEVAALPIPRDLLAGAVSVKRQKMEGDIGDFESFEVFGPTTRFDDGFVALIRITLKKPFLGRQAGEVITFTHKDMKSANHPFMHHGPYDITVDLTPKAAERLGFSMFSAFTESGWMVQWKTEEGWKSARSDGGAVVPEEMLETADRWVRDLLRPPAPPPPDDPGGPGIRIGIPPGASIGVIR